MRPTASPCKHDRLWVVANQQDEIDVLDPNAVDALGNILPKIVARLGDFGGIGGDGTIAGSLFPASPAFSLDGQVLYVSNLALYLPFAGVPLPAVDSPGRFWSSTTRSRRSAPKFLPSPSAAIPATAEPKARIGFSKPGGLGTRPRFAARGVVPSPPRRRQPCPIDGSASFLSAFPAKAGTHPAISRSFARIWRDRPDQRKRQSRAPWVPAFAGKGEGGRQRTRPADRFRELRPGHADSGPV